MAAVSGGLSHIPNGTEQRRKRHVHFEASINWNEESDKSSRGSETRRERREQNKRLKMNQQTKYEQIYLLVKSQNAGILGRLETLHQDDDVRFHLNRLTGHNQQAQERQAQGQPTFRESLAAFRNATAGRTYQQLTALQQQQIQVLSILGAFTAEFRDELPSEVITDVSSEDEKKTSKREKKLRVKKKKQQQKLENFEKGVNRRNGGPRGGPPGGSNLIA